MSRRRRTPAPGRPRPVRWIVGVAAAAAVVLGAVVAYRLLGVERDLYEATDLLVSAGERLESGDLAEARAQLERAEALLVTSNGSLYNSPELDVVGWLPGFGQNIRSLRRTVSVALELVSGGGRILDLARPLEDADGRLQIPLRAGAIPVDVAAAVRSEVIALARALPGRDEVPDESFLVGPVADAQREVYDEAVRRRHQLASVGQGLRLLTELSGGNGPRRYLIAVANTAEMRGSGGMILSYGVLESADGDFELADFGGIDDLFLEEQVDPAAVGAPADELRRWEGLEPTRLWRNVNLLPDLRRLLPRMAAMYEAATGQGIDGVIQIDAHGLAAILEGVGPVLVEGLGEVNAANAVALTLNEAYSRFPDRDQRQEVLGDVAEVTFRRLVDGEYESLRPLGEALARAAAERHILLVTERPDGREPAAFFGADGSLPDADLVDHALLTVQNFSRNKLDFYLDSAVQLSGSRPVGEVGEVEATVTVTNGAPPGATEPEYVFGDGSFSPPGTYRGSVSLYLPTGTALAGGGGTGLVSEPVVITEDGRTVVAFDIDLAAGETATATLQLQLPPRPPEPYRFVLVPVPRIRPTVWDVDLDLGPGGRIVRDGPLVRPDALVPVP